MSASFARPSPVLTIAIASNAEPWLASLDALDCSAEIIDAAGDIGAAGNTLFDKPGNRAAQEAAEKAARRVLAVIGRLRSVAS